MPSTLRTVCRFNYHNSYVYLCDNESITPLTLYLWMFGCTKTKKEKKNPVKEISSDSGFEVSRTHGKFH